MAARKPERMLNRSGVSAAAIPAFRRAENVRNELFTTPSNSNTNTVGFLEERRMLVFRNNGGVLLRN
jgi:hypothetical protein